MSVSGKIGELIEGIAHLEMGENPMTGKQFIKAYELDKAEKRIDKGLVKYSREFLLKFKFSPLAKGRPYVKDPVVNSMSCWSKPSRPVEDDVTKRRSGADPRERTRREAEGIILSPQRANFNNGCAVAPQRVPSQTLITHRRIGSGRLLKRDWDGDVTIIFRPSTNREERLDSRNDLNYENDNRGGRHSDKITAGEGDGRYRHRYNDDRSSRYGNDSVRNGSTTPEWFSGGPTSQDETIDLHGFDADMFMEKVKPLKGRKWEDREKQVSPSPKPIVEEASKNIEAKETTDASQAEEEIKKEESNFNIEEFLHWDNILPIFDPFQMKMEEQPTKSHGSRFSQFFASNGKEKGGAAPQSAASTSASATESQLKAMLQINTSSVPRHLPAEQFDKQSVGVQNSSTTQTPPYTSNVTQEAGLTLIELFRAEQQRHINGPSLKDLAATGKVTDVADIEAKIRQSQNVPDNQPNGAGSSDEVNPEVQAFIFKRAAQEAAQREQTRLMNFQLQQLLAERQHAAMMGKFIVPQPFFQQLPENLQHLIANAKPSIEICNSPDFVNYFAGLLQGRLTIQNIITQMTNNPNIDYRLNEILCSLLNLMLVNRDPLTLQQLVLQHGLQHMHRVPSSLELRAHTSNIMQNALIRRKLEEQAENYKKRESMRNETTLAASRGTSPIPPIVVQQGGNCALSFTPTAVLRKMTAEEKESRRMVRGAGTTDCSTPSVSRSPVPMSMMLDGPTSPSPKGQQQQQWGPPLRAITKTSGFDPARRNWSPPAQGPVPANFGNLPAAGPAAGRTYIFQPARIPQVANHRARVSNVSQPVKFPYQRPSGNVPANVDHSAFMGAGGMLEDVRPPTWAPEQIAQLRQRGRMPLHGRIINVEELERRNRPVRF